MGGIPAACDRRPNAGTRACAAVLITEEPRSASAKRVPGRPPAGTDDTRLQSAVREMPRTRGTAVPGQAAGQMANTSRNAHARGARLLLP